MIDTTPKGIESVIRGGESSSVEFKRSMPPSADLARIMSAFANSEGGTLLIGVDDNGAIVGVPGYKIPQAIEEIEKTAESVLFGPIDFNASKIEGRWVVWVHIPKAPAHLLPVRTADGQVYIRESKSIERKTNDRVPSTAARASKEIVIFVAMSFREGEEPALVDYYRAMDRAAQRTELPIRLERMDLVEGDFEISQEIMNRIDQADAVLADFTLSPKNVYFELGYARGRRKSVIQTAKKDTPLEFDVRNWVTLFYKNATELEELLVPKFHSLYERLGDGQGENLDIKTS
jgi:hypothetical protein